MELLDLAEGREEAHCGLVVMPSVYWNSLALSSSIAPKSMNALWQRRSSQCSFCCNYCCCERQHRHSYCMLPLQEVSAARTNSDSHVPYQRVVSEGLIKFSFRRSIAEPAAVRYLRSAASAACSGTDARRKICLLAFDLESSCQLYCERSRELERGIRGSVLLLTCGIPRTTVQVCFCL